MQCDDLEHLCSGEAVQGSVLTCDFYDADSLSDADEDWEDYEGWRFARELYHTIRDVGVSEAWCWL